MSRIGRMPVTLPAGVDVKVDALNSVTVKGPKGTLAQQFNPDMKITVENGVLTVERPSEEKEHKALHGLTRAIIANMVEGVTNGFSKKLEINGVGYRAAKQGKQLVLNIGYSHQVIVDEQEGITFEVPDANTVIVTGADKQKVGQIAAEIRSKRPPEPYLGKGIKYSDERIRRKAGKAGK
ncbi:MAG: 50S ribosomal protein L6 [Clostridiales bacterium]|nr:MAG: 50S ribosomal protein L6 [Clostridiales bacterium]